MELRAEIDRGDVWPGDLRRRKPRELRPIVTLFAKIDGGEVALVRWPTTIGGWHAEKMDGGRVVKRYKPSLPGDYLWTEVVGAPTWYPPSSTPDRELVRRRGGRWVPDEDAIGPGFRSAYGLAMVVHRSLDGADTFVRTHGTANYLSVLGAGDSHGCHRLFTHLALRLTSFLLVHRPTTFLGVAREAFQRRIEWEGKSFTLRRTIRGTVHVLDPPVPIRVLEGRVLSRRAGPNAW
jgi:hypothetical protein